ncbi:hypothetical protein ACFE04_028481 [Oxalis oulophora]
MAHQQQNQNQQSEDQPQQHQLGFPSSNFNSEHDRDQSPPPPLHPKSSLPSSDLNEAVVEELQSLELKDTTELDGDRLQCLDLKETELDGEEEEEEEEEESEYVNVVHVNDESGWEVDEETVNDYNNNINNNNNNNNNINNKWIGSCKFGSSCKFNHPLRARNYQGAKDKEKEQFGDYQPGQTECKYYLRTGGCKYGKACRFNHSKGKASGPSGPPTTSNLNFLGLPVRPGERECTYYMRTGSCKYGALCRFNHPDPTAVERSNAPSSYGNGSPQVSSQGAGQLGTASWSSPSALNEASPYVPLVYPPTQGGLPQGREWNNNYQAPPVYPAPPPRNLHPAPAYGMNNLANENNMYPHHQQQMVVDEFPERPGQPECSYYVKTGDCKFKSNCRYHHPRNRMPRSPICELSDKGLPLRPDQMVCSHYSRYGICKFGPSCKFDHPVGQSTSPTASGDHQPTHFGDMRTTNYENGRDVGIQQPA